MTTGKLDKKRMLLTGIALLSGLVDAAPKPPQVVAVPPAAAVRDLCRTADGEIRHYGWKTVDGERRRVYVASRDEGTNWTFQVAARGDVGAMVKSPWRDEWLYFVDEGSEHETVFVRSKTGPGDTNPERRRLGWRRQELRQLIALKTRRRWVAAFSDVRCENGVCYRAAVALSDDDGDTWRYSPVPPLKNVPRLGPGDRRPRWFNDGCEPSVVERNDGSLLMALRTSSGHHAFCESRDGGETWSEPRENSAFWATNTMPCLFRLRDGRLLFVWNNTAPLPTRDAAECPELATDAATLAGVWETVFTNRDALHAAISDDDGRTWRGFREIALTEPRNAPDFRELGNDPDDEHDKSVHQTQAIELRDGTVLIAYGQNSSTRRLARLNPDWLLETGRTEDFRHGLGGLSNHLYLKSLSGGWRGWAGHCAWNRLPGAVLMRDPDTDAGKGRVREILRLCRIPDPRLVSDRQGVVWNFPAAQTGELEIDCRIDGAGFRLTLADHWINPCDEFNPPRAPVSWQVTREMLGEGWHRLRCTWNGKTGCATLTCNGRILATATVREMPPFGLSYLHLQTLAEGLDADGASFRSFRAAGPLTLRATAPGLAPAAAPVAAP
jgi:hypothetical protein